MRKCIVFHPRMLPGQVIADPELTLGLPPNLTAWTGLRCPLAQPRGAVRAGLPSARRRHRDRSDPADPPLARAAAVEDGSDLAARGHMLAAASMGAIAFQKGLGAMHALAHPIGGLLDSHHGLTIAIVMPYVLARNRAAIETRLEQLDRTLGLAPGGFIDWVDAAAPGARDPATLAAARHARGARSGAGAARCRRPERCGQPAGARRGRLRRALSPRARRLKPGAAALPAARRPGALLAPLDSCYRGAHICARVRAGMPAAGVAELVDARDLGSRGRGRGGSSPFARTTFGEHGEQSGDARCRSPNFRPRA